MEYLENLVASDEWQSPTILIASVTLLATLLIAYGRSIRLRLTGHPEPAKTRPHRTVVGRDVELETIREALAADRIGVITPGVAADEKTFAVAGGGGMGKSTLARQYFDRYGESYDRRLWIEAETESGIIRRLAPEGPSEGSAKARARRAVETIGSGAETWLIVFDNAENRAAVEPWLPGGRARCLVTTRSQDWNAPGFRKLQLGVLEPDAAVKLLCDEAGREDPDAPRLAEALGRLPLGLVQAGALLRITGEPFAAYAEDLARVIETAPASGDYPDTLFASVSLSLRGLDRDATAILNLFAYLAPEGLEARLITDIPTSSVPNLKAFGDDIPEHIHDLAAHPARVEKALATLADRSLLMPEAATEGRTFALHRLTAAVVRARLARPDEPRAAAAVVAPAFPGGGEHNPAFAKNWPACARLVPHVAALHALGDARPATAAMDFLYNQASIYLGQQAEEEIALAYARAGLEISIARLGPDHRTVGAGHTVLGRRLHAAGDHVGAEAEFAEALRITEGPGGDAAVLPITLANHAGALVELAKADRAAGRAAAAADRFAQAEAQYRRALDLNRAAGDRRGEATRLSNLAWMHDAAGAADAARARAAEALEIRRDILSPDDPALASTLNNLGALHLKARDPAAARPLLEEALSILERAFPDKPSHPNRIATAQWLASCLFALSPPETAAAEDLCARYGLDPAERRARADDFRPL